MGVVMILLSPGHHSAAYEAGFEKRQSGRGCGSLNSESAASSSAAGGSASVSASVSASAAGGFNPQCRILCAGVSVR